MLFSHYHAETETRIASESEEDPVHQHREHIANRGSGNHVQQSQRPSDNRGNATQTCRLRRCDEEEEREGAQNSGAEDQVETEGVGRPSVDDDEH